MASFCNRCGQMHTVDSMGMCPPPLPGPVKIPFKCPVCDGSKKVSRPPWIAGDMVSWLGGDPGALYDCRACDATGIVWGTG